MEDELFKPTEGGKGSEDAGEGSGGEGVPPALNANVTKGASWLTRSPHQRKIPEQTELYAQLLRAGQTADGDAARNFGDHDYCALSLGEKRKRSAAMLGAMLQVQGAVDGASTPTHKAADDLLTDGKVKEDEGPLVVSPVAEPTTLVSSSPPDCQMGAATPPSSEEEAERSSASRSPSPTLHHCPDSPASKTDSRWVRPRSDPAAAPYVTSCLPPLLCGVPEVRWSLPNPVTFTASLRRGDPSTAVS